MKQATVIYDADCGFCRWSLAVLLRMARRGTLRPLPLGTPEADRILADLTVAEREASWHLWRGSGGVDAGDVGAVDVGAAGRDAEAIGAAPAAAPARGAVGRDAEATGLATTGAPAQGAAAPTRFSADAALAPAMEFVPAGAIPGALFRRFPGASERGYRWVAEHRGLLGRLVGDRARRWAGRVIAAHGGPPQ